MPKPSAARSVQIGLFVLAVAYFALGTGSLAVVGLLGPMSRSLDVEQTQVAQLVTVFALTFAVAAPGFQVAFGHWSRRGLLLFGLAVQAVGCLGAALAPTLSWAIAARVVLALGGAAVGPMASSLAAYLVPPQQQVRALSFVFGGLIVATVFGVPFATWVGQALGWRGVFFALAALSIACIPATMHFIHDRSENAPLRIGALVGLLRDGPTAWSILVSLLQTSGQFATYTLVALLLTDRFGLPASRIPLALLLFGIGGVVGNALGGRLGDRYSPTRLVWISIVGLAMMFVAMSFAPVQPAAGLALMTAWAVLAMLFQAPQQKRLLGYAPGYAGLVLALNSSAIYVGISLGALSGSLMLHRFGIGGLPVLSAAWLCTAIVALVLTRPAEERASP
ncbi:MAG: MFS transporter [Steroidobacteraceae bacterium]